ncbi:MULTISPECIES: ParB/RepB/Spo0J family partition protein [unclassified Ruminococcus]|uniref:ParB/RepB/Spo0J family partition protein n=1 Tax=unclassified Ruminococcus TaxID=2608920 RepID=UPI0025BAE930|nr:ParB/RepB/Spo0J family partition protein [Frisingicoccus sp.]
MKERVGQKIKLTNYEALLGVSNEESAVDVSIRDIHSFENHPFKVIDDDKMAELVESIKVNGVLTPVLIRPSKKTRGYEMISGHRRLHAAGLAGLSMIPAIVREMDDDTAVLAMVDANIQREELLPSEKAFAFKMKMDAMRHQGTSRHEVEKSEKWTCEKVGEAGGIGGRQVQRYIRLTELIPELIEFVDKKKIQLSLGVDISYIDKEIQKWIYEYIKENGTVKPKQISALREECEKGVMTQPKLIMIMNNHQTGKTSGGKLTISEKKLREYFPASYGSDDIKNVLFQLLDKWKNGEV